MRVISYTMMVMIYQQGGRRRPLLQRQWCLTVARTLVPEADTVSHVTLM